jgi:hypothetical protein
MSAISQYFSSHALKSSLYGVRQSFERLLGLKDLQFIFHNHQKTILKRKENDKYPYYPYGFFRITGIGIQMDQQAIKGVQRHGINARFTESLATNSTTTKLCYFPGYVNMEFHYFHTDAMEVLTFCEALIIMGKTESFNFTLQIAEDCDWICRLALEQDEVNPPSIDLTDTSEPAACEIVANFKLHTKMGIEIDVGRVNSNTPQLSFAAHKS